jgi:hypothetical protein
MKKFIPKIIKNQYFECHDSFSDLESSFELIDATLTQKIIPIQYINLLLGYPSYRWTEETDIFQFLDNNSLNKLKKENCILIFDGTFEGYSYESYPIRKSLEIHSLKHDINPKKIFFFTGNLLDDSDIINVIPINNLDAFFIYNPSVINQNLENAEKICRQKMTEKIFLSLSRRNRYHRVLANFVVYNSEIFSDGLISQDNIEKDFFNIEDLDKINSNIKTFKRFKKSLPWIIDQNDFTINEPRDPLIDLHHLTPFSIVNETICNSENNTSLFLSEKFFKPIISFQPMIIYGQPGINRTIEKLGYSNYSSYFDLSFDDEEDDVIRYQKLIKSITPTVKMLKAMAREERIDWRFKDKKLLKNNHEILFSRIHVKETMNKFAQTLINLIETENL